MGAFWLVSGIMEIIAGIAGRGERGRTWSIVVGVIGVLGGIVILAAPVPSAVALAWVLGVFLIVHGVVVIVAGSARQSGSATTTTAGQAESAPPVSNGTAAPTSQA